MEADSALVSITAVSPTWIWRHGYRMGYRHGATGRPHMLDDETEDGAPADVIPLCSRHALPESQLITGVSNE